MGVVEFEQNRLKQKEIEVRALVALLHNSNNPEWRDAAEVKLFEFAFPEEIAEIMEQEDLQTKLEYQ